MAPMVVLDSSTLLPARRKAAPHIPGPLVGMIALGCALLVVGALLAHGFSENGFRLGSRLAWRYGCLVFFAALVAGPICRLLALAWPSLIRHEVLGRKLIWGFCASHGVYLLSILAPHVVPLSAGATLMLVLGGGMALTMAVAAAPMGRPGAAPLIADPARRILMGVAMTWFWLCYGVMALARLSGPHRPDAFYGISLGAMVAALLLRFADRWFARPSRTPAP